MNKPPTPENRASLNPLGVPAHRHPNGGGWVADSAIVLGEAYVGPIARVFGGAVLGGYVHGGTIHGGTIHGGTIHGGYIYGGYIYGGDIRGGVIRGGVIHRGVIRDTRDILTVGPIGSEDQYLTLVRSDTGHRVSIGCWWERAATIDDIAAEVRRRAPEFADEYAELMPMLRRRVDEWDAERNEVAS